MSGEGQIPESDLTGGSDQIRDLREAAEKAKARLEAEGSGGDVPALSAETVPPQKKDKRGGLWQRLTKWWNNPKSEQTPSDNLPRHPATFDESGLPLRVGPKPEQKPPQEPPKP